MRSILLGGAEASGRVPTWTVWEDGSWCPRWRRCWDVATVVAVAVVWRWWWRSGGGGGGGATRYTSGQEVVVQWWQGVCLCPLLPLPSSPYTTPSLCAYDLISTLSGSSNSPPTLPSILTFVAYPFLRSPFLP